VDPLLHTSGDGCAEDPADAGEGPARKGVWLGGPLLVGVDDDFPGRRRGGSTRTIVIFV
jgi:hypothetical protein